MYRWQWNFLSCLHRVYYKKYKVVNNQFQEKKKVKKLVKKRATKLEEKIRGTNLGQFRKFFEKDKD